MNCTQLMNVELREGVERIEQMVFCGCISLEQISFPSSIKVIDHLAFKDCIQLVNVELRDGLTSIRCRAFHNCTSLEQISIPSTVHFIHNMAFSTCTALVAIQFSEEIEEFVSELPLPLQNWWNNGVSKHALWTGSFFARCNIPARVGMIKLRAWKEKIHDMLLSIPFMNFFPENYIARENCYFNVIHSQLANYEYLQDIAPFLELALWKTKIIEHSNGNLINDNVKLMCRIDSFSMFAIVFPNVLSFLEMPLIPIDE